MTNATPDTSTIDWAKLAKLARVAKIADSYHVDSSKQAGSGCYGEPPGHPSYFIRSVWTKYGNSPPRGANQVLAAPGGTLYAVRHGYRDEIKDVDLDAIYLPLPIDHPRVKAWIYSTMRHFQHCFDAEIIPREKHDSGKTVIFPVPDYRLRHFTDDPRFSDAWRTTERAAIAQHNAEIIEQTAKVATVDNHQGVRIIRKWYPDWTPTTLDPTSFKCPAGDWFERYAERPTPDKCPGPFFALHSDDNCQFCGMGRE